MTQEERNSIIAQFPIQYERLKRMDELEDLSKELQCAIDVLNNTPDEDFDVDWSHTISTLKCPKEDQEQVKKALDDAICFSLIKDNLIDQLKDTLRLVNQEIEDI